MRECRTPGSVRGVPGNRHPYRDLPYRSAGALIIVTSACHPCVIMALLVVRPCSSPGRLVGTGTEGEPTILHDIEVTTLLASCVREIEV